MYGMVNRAIEDMVCSAHGPQVWEQIKEKAGIDVDIFVGNDPYPDEMTYKLVGASCEVLGLPADMVLQAFGRHWVRYTGSGTYKNLLRSGGASIQDFLVNLPNFHTRVHMIFPRLQPPMFEVSDQRERCLSLHYRTQRPGLSQFVIGLLHGLGEHFGTPVSVTQTASKDGGEDHDIFSVSW